MSRIGSSSISRLTGINSPAGDSIIDETNDSLRVSITGDFNTNDIDQASATVTYIGQESATGAWYIKKIDTSSGNSFQHATEANNGSYTDYATAWANRATLTYEDYSEAF